MLTATQASYDDYRAPARNNTALIEPPLEQAAHPMAELAGDAILLDRSLAELRRQGRRELLEAATAYTRGYRDLPTPGGKPLSAADVRGVPLFLTGHQAELFHAGVWFKNFVASRLAREHRGVAIHLVIDSDLPRAASIRVPTGPVRAPWIETVPYDAPTQAAAVEERRIRDRPLFESFAQRVEQTLAPLVERPLVRDLWPMAIEAAQRNGGVLGLSIAEARHRLEGQWGAETLEVPLSHCCELPVFRHFACYLLAHACEVRQAYNGALQSYRAAHHLRNHAQPMPDLATDGQWCEAPFWVWQAGRGRRQPLFLRHDAHHVELTDRQGWRTTLDLAAGKTSDTAVQQLEELAAAGGRLRTRALTTTLFARLVLGDLFLHGIGGAKYDQVTDDLAMRLFGFAPPPLLTLSATLELPIDHPRGGEDDVRDAQWWLRELTFHPEKHLPAGASKEALAFAAEKRRWIATPKTPENAAERHQAISRANAALRGAVAHKRRRVETRLARYQRLARARTILNARDYAFCLFPEDDLRERMRRLVEG